MYVKKHFFYSADLFFQVPRTDKSYVQRALMDENVQYLVIAMYWCWIKPISCKYTVHVFMRAVNTISNTHSLHHILPFPSPYFHPNNHFAIHQASIPECGRHLDTCGWRDVQIYSKVGKAKLRRCNALCLVC